MSTSRRAPLGRLSRRELPFEAPLGDDLDDRTRAAVVAAWMTRAGGERQAAIVFEAIARDLRAVEAPSPFVELAERAQDDERRHSEICRRVASRYAGTDLPAGAVPTPPIPRYLDAPEAMRPLLRIVAMCCINETTATAMYERALQGARPPLVRGAIRELLGDDIDHARIGWLYLDSLRVRAALPSALTAWVPSLVRANLEVWRATVGEPDDSLEVHGCPSAAATWIAVRDAARDLVLPGFERLGMDTAAARASLPA